MRPALRPYVKRRITRATFPARRFARILARRTVAEGFRLKLGGCEIVFQNNLHFLGFKPRLLGLKFGKIGLFVKFGFVVAFISIVYIATAVITIDETGKTISQIIADGTIAFLLGLFINRVFDLQGMMNGEREEKVIATKQLHGEMVMKISPNIEKLDDWCEIENRKNYRVQRTKILARAGLKYEDCFDENGVAKQFKVDKEKMQDKYLRRQELKRLALYNKAVNLKLTALSAGELTSEGGKQQDPYYFGRTKAQYEASRSIMDIISKIGIAVIIGYYGVGLIEEFSYANVLERRRTKGSRFCAIYLPSLTRRIPTRRRDGNVSAFSRAEPNQKKSPTFRRAGNYRIKALFNLPTRR